MQRIWVFQQNGSGEPKIRGVREHGRGVQIEMVDIDGPLPEVIDEPEALLPREIDADLVLDHLRHPDLTHALALRCHELGIPVVASGKRVPVPGLVAPPTCCGLAEREAPDPYRAQFGLPAYRVALDEAGRVCQVEVRRGAPCGATWAVVGILQGLTPAEAVIRAGLGAQLNCSADPSGWDPFHGKSPVHFAGRVHARALRRALLQAGVSPRDLGPTPYDTDVGAAG